MCQPVPLQPVPLPSHHRCQTGVAEELRRVGVTAAEEEEAEGEEEGVGARSAVHSEVAVTVAVELEAAADAAAHA